QDRRAVLAPAERAGAGAVIIIEQLTVRFGGVLPLDEMTLTLPEGTCGLIGPNGARKTTFFHVLSGLLRPVPGTGHAFDTGLPGLADCRRARWGVRRTFQTEQAIADLTVFDNVLLVHEQTGASRATRRHDVLAAAAFVGLEEDVNKKVGTLGAG